MGFLGDAFRVLSAVMLSGFCTVLTCGARLPKHTLNFWTRFLSGGVFECDIAHRRSVAVLGRLCKIRFNPMHPRYGALPVPYVQVRVTGGALVVHRYTYALPLCRTSQYRRTFILLSVSLWNDLADPVFDRVGLSGF